MNIEVTQYLRPNGEQRETSVDVPDSPDIKMILKEIKRVGLRLTAEVLSTGECSFTLEYPKQAIDYDIELSQNGPGETGTKAAVLRLLRRFDRDRFDAWKKAADEEDDGLGVGWGT